MKHPYRCLFVLLAAFFDFHQTAITAESTQDPVFKPSESYTTITRNGAWCWFSDPRAVYHERRKKMTYMGWVNGSGDIVVAAYDHASGKIDTAVVHEKLEKDDHANPSILVRDDGRILVFYSKHSRNDGPLSMRMSIQPEDIREWEPERYLLLNNNPDYPADYRKDFCYSNPYQLSDENQKIYLFWRGIDFKPCFSTSSDGGSTWDIGRILIRPEDVYPERRPYVKYDSKGKDKIHIAFTDGHPRDEQDNSLYYACYRNGAFFKANGQKIMDILSLPMHPRQADVVYDATQTHVRSWIWDVAEDKKGRPVIVYTRLPEKTDHRYHYAVWNGENWEDHEITPAGQWFPKTPAGKREPEPHYSGGIVLDHNDPSKVYLSRLIEGIFEIEKWITKDKGKSWKSEAVTSGSAIDNVRPFVVRNHPSSGPSVLWMANRKYVHYTDFDAAIKMNRPIEPLSAEIKPEAVVRAMARVADWQLANPSRHETTDWTHGAFFAGLTAWAFMAVDSNYLHACRQFAEKNGWRPGGRMYHADDHCVGAMYLDLIKLDQNPTHLKPIKDRFDAILQNPSTGTLKKDQQNGMDRWWWCDALFMGPPVWTKLTALTGDRKYLDFMNSEWWATTDYLYDKDEHLYFRDDSYFSKREANGKKVFWSRGNGWVIAGLARVIQDMPRDYIDRPKYLGLFKEMSAIILSIQPPDGLWRPSLLDPASYPNPETSGSGFFCFALAWGINNGVLDRAHYLPAVQKAWAGLIKSVHLDGKLGFVQPIGADPKRVNAEQTEIYGVGAFLLAGSEVYKLALSTGKY
jgi:rhamnogalacturonyl hydrolase YesR